MRISIYLQTGALIACWRNGDLCPDTRLATGAAAAVVPPARIVSFTAQPETVQSGQPATLVWATENPNGINISPDIGRVAARGTRLVNPAATTTYTLTVAGPNNTSLTQSVTVKVAADKPAAASPATSGRHPGLHRRL